MQREENEVDRIDHEFIGKYSTSRPNIKIIKKNTDIGYCLSKINCYKVNFVRRVDIFTTVSQLSLNKSLTKFMFKVIF